MVFHKDKLRFSDTGNGFLRIALSDSALFLDWEDIRRLLADHDSKSKQKTTQEGTWPVAKDDYERKD